jgi:hypothetical protein
VTDDRPTIELPATRPAEQPPAWADKATRRAARRQLWVAVLLFVLAAVAATATVLVARLGFLAQPWGMPVMVAAGGLAGGALSGAVTLLVLWIRLRAFLRGGPWFTAEMTLRERRYATLRHGPHVAEVRLEVATAGLGEPEDRFPVEVRSDGGPHLITVPPSRRMFRAVTSEDGEAAEPDLLHRSDEQVKSAS